MVSTRRAKALLVGSVFSGVLSAVLFTVFPQLDMELAAQFHVEERRFVGHHEAVRSIRHLLKLVFGLAAAIAIIGMVITTASKVTLGGWSARKWIFLVLCLSVGPGLVANVIFKDHWGRARPRHVETLGGNKSFTPAIIPADQCHKNCSFVSGESSSIFALFFALFLLIRKHARFMIALTLLSGLSAGFIRISQGAHFLSDVVFSGVFMGCTIAFLHLLVFSSPGLFRKTLYAQAMRTYSQNPKN